MLRPLRSLCRLVSGALVLIGLATMANADITLQTVDYYGWKRATRLSNGTVEVIVIAQIGRIMRYGYIGGPNLIWEDPALWGKPADTKTFPRFGGNKAWPWPQDEWPSYIGHDWPPPPQADQSAYSQSTSGSDTVHLRSAPLAGFGLVIDREIRLAQTGTRVTIATRLSLADKAARPAHPIAAWSITPAAAPNTLLVALTPDPRLPARYKPLGSFDPFASITTESNVMKIVRNPEKSSKIGIDGDAIGAVYGDTLWTLTANRFGLGDSEPGWTPGERIQIYANADSHEDLARGLPPYMELEMTSPRAALSQARPEVTLTETWELRKLGKGQDARRAFAAALGPL